MTLVMPGPKYENSNWGSNFMRLLLGKGEISLLNLLAAFFFAKTISLLAFLALQNYCPPNANLSTFISRSLELSIFLSLITVNFLPRKFPFGALFRVPNPPTKQNIVFQLVTISILTTISRYAIELLVVVPSLFLEPATNQHVEQLTQPSTFGAAPLIMILTGKKILAQITIVPFVEEIIYRGVLLNFLLTRCRTVNALIFSSVIFAVFHGNPITAFLGGLVFGYVYIFTKNVWLCVFAHSIANITVVFMNRFGDYIYPSFRNDASTAGLSIWICSIIGFSWLVSLIATMIKYRKINSHSIFPT